MLFFLWRKRGLGVLVLLGVTATTSGQGLTATEREIAAFLENHSDEAITLLERVVNINSGTLNVEGVRAVGDQFRVEFEVLGMRTRWASMPEEMGRAGHLFAESQGGVGKRLLLIGHLDTVFEPSSPFQVFERNGNSGKGPGAGDMKGGDVVILYALKALQHVGVLQDARITVALIGDEEKSGRPLEVSRRDLIEAGKRADIALGFEPGRPGVAVVARRGTGAWVLKVEGTPGHSSLVFGDEYGSGAIFEAARILNAFHNVVRGPQYLTFNPGVIVGGTDVQFDPATGQGSAFGKTNVIAQFLTVHGGLRTISEQQEQQARDLMNDIVAHGNLPGTSASIQFTDGYPPMSPSDGNRTLLGQLNAVSLDLGSGEVTAIDPGERGAADISFVAPYLSGLDGLGPISEDNHTVDETIDLGSLLVATKRAAVLIYRLTRQ